LQVKSNNPELTKSVQHPVPTMLTLWLMVCQSMGYWHTTFCICVYSNFWHPNCYRV